MADKYLYSDIENWESFSDRTKEDITQAGEDGKDIIQYIADGDIKPIDVVQKFQSLADPAFIGSLAPVEDWTSFHIPHVSGPVMKLEPYLEDESISSHALAASNITLNRLALPLKLSYGNAPAVFDTDDEHCPRFDKIIDLFKLKLGLVLTIEPSSNRFSPFYKQKALNKNNITIFNHIGDGGNALHINEYEQIVLLNSIFASQYVDDYLKVNKKQLKPTMERYGTRVFDCITNAAQDLATLLITRSIYFGHNENQYKIDEALKLQVSNGFALLSSEGKEATTIVYNLAIDAAKSVIHDLGFTKDYIVQNMQEMGFVYPKNPETIVDALITANNFEKRFDAQRTQEEIEEVDEAPVEIPATVAINAALAQAAMLSRGITKLRHIIPSYLDEQLVTKKQRKTSLMAQNLEANMCEDVSISLKRHLKKNLKNAALAQAVYSNYFTLKQDITNEVIDNYKENRLTEEKPKSATKRLHEVLYRRYATVEEKENSTRVTSSKLLRRGLEDLIEKQKQILNPVVPEATTETATETIVPEVAETPAERKPENPEQRTEEIVHTSGDEK